MTDWTATLTTEDIASLQPYTLVELDVSTISYRSYLSDTVFVSTPIIRRFVDAFPSEGGGGYTPPTTGQLWPRS